MKYIRVTIWLLLIPVFLFGALASMEPSQGAPFHAGWLAFYIGAIVTMTVLLVREFRSRPEVSENRH